MQEDQCLKSPTDYMQTGYSHTDLTVAVDIQFRLQTIIRKEIYRGLSAIHATTMWSKRTSVLYIPQH